MAREESADPVVEGGFVDEAEGPPALLSVGASPFSVPAAGVPVETAGGAGCFCWYACADDYTSVRSVVGAVGAVRCGVVWWRRWWWWGGEYGVERSYLRLEPVVPLGLLRP